jgi:hypothetical protein
VRYVTDGFESPIPIRMGSGRRYQLTLLINETIKFCTLSKQNCQNCPTNKESDSDRPSSLLPLLICLFKVDKKKELLRSRKFRPEYPRFGRSNRSWNHLQFGLPGPREVQIRPGVKPSPRSTGSLTIREAQNCLTSLNERRDFGSLLRNFQNWTTCLSLPLKKMTNKKKSDLTPDLLLDFESDNSPLNSFPIPHFSWRKTTVQDTKLTSWRVSWLSGPND